jgi:hypothetical protein
MQKNAKTLTGKGLQDLLYYDAQRISQGFKTGFLRARKKNIKKDLEE